MATGEGESLLLNFPLIHVGEGQHGHHVGSKALRLTQFLGVPSSAAVQKIPGPNATARKHARPPDVSEGQASVQPIFTIQVKMLEISGPFSSNSILFQILFHER